MCSLKHLSEYLYHYSASGWFLWGIYVEADGKEHKQAHLISDRNMEIIVQNRKQNKDMDKMILFCI